jgi:enterochelin esterase-like enzyme
MSLVVSTHTVPGTAAGDIDVLVMAPAAAKRPLPLVLLLHGRQGHADDWLAVRPALDAAIDAGSIREAVFVAPDGRWSDRGSWWVDSAHHSGALVQTALVDGVLPWIDRKLPVVPHRSARTVAGVSMGGAGAVLLALARRDLFDSAVALSPAIYLPPAPADSSVRTTGAFGAGDVVFDEARFEAYSYLRLLADAAHRPPALDIAVIVGDGESARTGADEERDLVFEAARLYRHLRTADEITAHLRVTDGGHDWQTWRSGLVAGLELLNSRKR